MAEVPPDFNHIIVCGKQYKLANDDVKVVTFAHPEGIEYSFPAKSRANEAAGKPRLQAERIQKGQRVNAMDWDKIREVVRMVVIHTDLTSSAKGCFNALVGRNLSTHFMIDWDGTIYQGMDLGYQAFHGGATNSVSIGIDMNNKMPNLQSREKANNPPYPEGHPAYESRTSKGWPHKRPKSRMKKFNGGRVKSYGYTDPQYTALIALLTKLTEQDMFKLIKRTYPMDAKGEVIPNVIEGGDAFEGLVGHMHVSATRWDPGPGFDWQRVLAGMIAENNSFPITLKGGDTISILLEREKVKAHARKYFLLNESGTSDWSEPDVPEGGWFPISANQTWHGGIHLQAPRNTPVLAMFEGKLVAARFNKCTTKLGSNNFMLLRHEVEIPNGDAKKKKKAKKLLVFYSLYMHLEYIDVFNPAMKKQYEWVEKLFEHGKGETDDEKGFDVDKAADDPGLEKERKKKKKKGKDKPEKKTEAQLDGEEQESIEDEQFDEGDEDCPQTRPKRHGPGLRFLREGNVATFEYEEDPIIVGASRAIAPIGWFDPTGGESADKRQVHVEVFADDSWKDAVDLAVHGEFFTEVQQVDPSDRSLFIKNKGLLAAFSPSGYVTTKNSLVKSRVLSRQEIADLFTMNEPGNISLRRRLRKIAVKHISEWSDQVDWVKALSDAEDWNGKVKDYRKRIGESGLFKASLERVLPFIWLDGEIAETIGLQNGGKEWTGQIWHFHPIHFLMWLTFHSARRVQKLSRSVSKKELKRLKKKEEEDDGKIEDDPTLEGTRGVDYGAALDDVEVEDVDIHQILDDYMISDDVGEWRDVREGELDD